MNSMKPVELAKSPLSDPETQRCPYPLYQKLQADSPVYWDEGLKVFIVTGYELIRQAATDVQTFSSEGSASFPYESKAAEAVAAIRSQTYATTPLTVSQDPPIHTEYRGIMNGVLSRARMRDAAPLVQSYVSRFIGEMVAKKEADFVEEYAVRLPFAVICTMLGLKEDMWSKVRQWADSYTAPLFGTISAADEIRCAHLFVERQRYFEEQVALYRETQDPCDNLVSALALARRQDGALLSVADVLSMIEQFVVAGAETTKNALASGAYLMAQDPSIVQALRSDERKVDSFVEEVLRLRAPAQAMMRLATRDTQLAGVLIPKGSRVMLRFGAGNVDASKFPDPERCDIARGNARSHLTFGYGIHTCQGAPLARSELAFTFRTLVNLPGSFAIKAGKDTVEHLHAHSFMGFKRLVLIFDMSKNWS